MKILFLCGIYPPSYKDEIFKNSKKGYQFAAQNLQEAIVDGFIQNNVDLNIVTVPFLSTFPVGYKTPVVKYKPTDFKGIVHIECASFINIPFLKNTVNTAEKDVFKWCALKYSGIKHIIIYSLNVNLLKIAIKAKKAYGDIQLSVIVPDLPEFKGYNYIYKFLGLKERDIKYTYNNLCYIDSFILLSEAMRFPLGITDNNYVVVEGIFNSIPEITDKAEIEKDIKTILYTGALSLKYGIGTLLKAFFSIPNPEYRLIICGDGDAKGLVQQASEQDERITYMGKVPYDLILKLQKKASLLVNPRTPAGEYTKFSFPSKTMEYLASGAPVLMYKLPGIPAQYFKYCYTLEDFSQDALAAKITEILSLPLGERTSMAVAAKRFILEQKNAKIQVRKIIEMIKNI